MLYSLLDQLSTKINMVLLYMSKNIGKCASVGTHGNSKGKERVS